MKQVGVVEMIVDDALQVRLAHRAHILTVAQDLGQLALEPPTLDPLAYNRRVHVNTFSLCLRTVDEHLHTTRSGTSCM